jgi:hypothetical protein
VIFHSVNQGVALKHEYALSRHHPYVERQKGDTGLIQSCKACCSKSFKTSLICSSVGHHLLTMQSRHWCISTDAGAITNGVKRGCITFKTSMPARTLPR